MMKKLLIFLFLLSFSIVGYGFSFSKTFSDIGSFISRHNIFKSEQTVKKKLQLDDSGMHILVGNQHARLQQWKTKNGSQVYFVKINELPILDVRVIFSAGSAYDKGKQGLAALTNNLLDEGSGKLNADQIAEGFDNVGAIFSADANQDMGVLVLRSLTKKPVLNSAIDLLHTVLVKPIFPERAFLREKSRTLKEIAAQKQAPSIISMQIFYKKLYGNQVYASSVEGNTASVSKITRKEVVHFYKQYYVAKNSIIVMVGDITTAQARTIASHLVKGLPSGNVPKQILLVKPINASVNYHLNYPSTQTYITSGYLGVKYSNPNYYALVVGNYILGGGGLISRLFDAVRSQHGLAYSVRSQFDILQQRGPFYVTLQTANKQTKQALNVVDSVLNDFIINGPTDEELSNAKKHITGSFLLKLDSNEEIANALVTLGFYHLSLDFFNTYCAKINVVTADQIKKTFYDLISSQKKVVVTVG